MWAHIPPSQGTSAHELLRWRGVPVCTLRRTGADRRWMTETLEPCGTKSRTDFLDAALSTREAKEAAEARASSAGWRKQ